MLSVRTHKLGPDYSVTCSFTTEVKSFEGIIFKEFAKNFKPGSKKFAFSNVSEVAVYRRSAK